MAKTKTAQTTTAPDASTTPIKPLKHHSRFLISQEEINTAVKGNSSHCMISNAIKHQNSHAKSISTDLQTIRWTDRRNEIRYVWLTPVTAQEALVRFDQGNPVKPFEFRLGQPVAETRAGRTVPAGTGRPRKKVRRHVRVRHAAKGAITVTTVGKPLPPVAALPGSRRRFGLKQLKIGVAG